MLDGRETTATFGDVSRGDSILDQTFSSSWALVLAVRELPDNDLVALLVSESPDAQSDWITRFRANAVRVRRRAATNG